MNIILQPLISEKVLQLKEKKNVYTFKVSTDANKNQIAGAVEKMFSVKPILVKTSIVRGKKRPMNRFRKASYGADWKKVYVTLAKGEKIKELE